MMTLSALCTVAALALLAAETGRFAAPATPATPAARRKADRIQPWPGNRRYWQFKGKPVVALGGSVDDNLFQIPDLADHLKLLASVGGNVIRNTMSDRPDKGYEIKAFHRGDDGLYDLTRWNDAYWQRFETMLKLTSRYDIIVQIEVWDRFDHSRDNWRSDPFNPEANVNYSSDESGLAAEYPDHPGRNKQPFFFTPPTMDDNAVVLAFQQRFVDKMLSYSLNFDHVLYCMDNETSADPRWARYWAGYIRARAAEAGVEIELTEMWDKWDVRDAMHRNTLDHPELYDFVDISQNSQTTGQANWVNAQWVRRYIANKPRPINSTKIYGADTGTWLDRGIDERHAKNSFWRNIIGGFATSRFHRPISGLGLSSVARTQITSARMLLAELDIFHCEPDADFALLDDRAENEAYATRSESGDCAVYFTDGGAVRLKLPNGAGAMTLTWLDIDHSRWGEASGIDGARPVELACPGPGQWVALVKVKQ